MRTTPSERQVHVELWRESGLSKAAYCREADISYQSFVAWTNREASSQTAGSEESSGPAFVQLDDDRPGPARPDDALVVRRGDLELTFAAGSGPDWVAAVLAGLVRC